VLPAIHTKSQTTNSNSQVIHRVTAARARRAEVAIGGPPHALNATDGAASSCRAIGS